MSKEKLGRYGENPHQTAWKERDAEYKGPHVLTTPLNGLPGYNNLQDANAALEVMIDLHDRPAVVIVKHKNPCGLATGSDLGEAFTNAWRGDEISAFGSVVGYSQEVDEDALKLLKGRKVDVLVAPSYADHSLSWIAKNKHDLTVIQTGPLKDAPDFVEEHKIRGGALSQTSDNRLYLCARVEDLLSAPRTIHEENSGLEYQVGVVAGGGFPLEMGGLVEFSIIAGKHTKSNAIILAYEYEKGKYRVLGMGAGQPNRKDSGEKLALPKARENLMRQYFREQGLDYAMTVNRMIEDKRYDERIREEVDRYSREILGSKRVVLFSDAFFPFKDGLVAAAELGVKYIVAPGGSKNDDEVIQAAKEFDVHLCFTGIRHFKH